MLVDGQQYKDGWGVTQTVGGTTQVNPDWVWTVQGNWYRRSDGRFVRYVPVNPNRRDGHYRHVAADKPSNWDLIVK